VIAVDWGTSSLRCYRMDGEGGILEARTEAKGILAVPAGKFADVLEEQVGDWIGQGESPVVMSGMVGSRQGWVEVPYVPCPAGYAEIAAAMRKVRDGVWVVPGVSCRDAAGVPDVMRGEEVQILGAGRDGLFCLPGTHSKWVEVEEGRLKRFSTHMTGEVYAVLKQHSILGRMMEEGAADANAFAQGVARAGQEGGLLHHLFGVRTRGLMGELGATASASYLSGILIGHELGNVRAREVCLLGAPALTGLYDAAATLLGIKAQALDPHAAARGLFRLGGMLR
jgi:2-dehydro-3-deoxygalactonokinase